jgi:hypothetical protein
LWSRGGAVVSPALDFVVIGAQKGGTTTLFEHLRRHPDLCLPADKEAPFFNRPELFSRGVDHLFGTYFPHPLPEGKLLGTVTPQYMCIAGCAERLASAFPSARLMAILRDPVDRAYSHYRMAVRRGMEERSFNDAIAAMLADDRAIDAARTSKALADTYVAWGEYGRVLSDYRDRFPAEQLLVTYTDDLEQDPAGVIAAMHGFLGVPVLLPEGVGDRYHVGTSRRRFPTLQRRLRSSPAGSLWRRLPQGTRSRAFMRFELWNVRRGAPPGRDIEQPDDDGRGAPCTAETERRLRAHFAADQRALAERYGIELPWQRL